MKNSRIAIFFHPYFSDGGVERTNIYLAKGLLDQGYQVEFLTTHSTEHYRREVEDSGIQMTELGNTRTIFTIGKVINHLRKKSNNYQSVYFISCQYYVNVVSMIVAMILRHSQHNIRFINSERNHFNEMSINGGIKNYFTFFLIKYLYKYADIVIANSEETAKDLSTVISRKVYWVYNPAINKRIDILKNEKITEEWFLSDSRPCVIGVGRLSLQKDFLTLVKAFKLVRKKFDAKLVILGEGELRDAINDQVTREGLTNDVSMPGFVDNPYKFLAASRVFVLSSRYEGLPNVLIEAVYLGIPCISTDCKSGPREILFGDEGGYLVPVGDIKRMADAILFCLENPEKNRKKIETAMHGISRFTYEHIRYDFEKAINL